MQLALCEISAKLQLESLSDRDPLITDCLKICHSILNLNQTQLLICQVCVRVLHHDVVNTTRDLAYLHLKEVLSLHVLIQTAYPYMRNILRNTLCRL